MLTKKAIELIKASVPVLEAHGEEITTVFYGRLFSRHPELMNMFNMMHQKTGGQPKVLAHALHQYALHIENLTALESFLEIVVHKHVSLHVLEEMYPLVGENLLYAIEQVLGDSATPELMSAWNDAYSLLADILINKEKELYESNIAQKNGYEGYREYSIMKKVAESDVITSFYLRPIGGDKLPEFRAGQYVAITVEVPGENHRHTRHYSLSDSPSKDYLRISVKREVGMIDGIVSNHLHLAAKEGDLLKVGMPSGSFVLRKPIRPIVLIAGGVGITPLLSMCKTAVEDEVNQPITFIRCALNNATAAFTEELSELKQKGVRVSTIFSNPLDNDRMGLTHNYEGYMTREVLTELGVGRESDFYFCGPKAFMELVKEILEDMGVDGERISYEYFGPLDD